MSKKSRNKYNEFMLRWEKSELTPVSRREFVKLMAMASAGLSIPYAHGCSNGNGALVDGGQSGTQLLQAGQGGVVTNTTTTTTLAAGSGGSTGAGGSAGARNTAGSSGTANAGKGGSGGKAGAAGSAGKAGTAGGAGDTGNPNYTCPTCAHVGITRNEDITKAVATAIGLAGGLGAIKKGDTVVIKPNLTGFSETYVTHPSVLKGIILAISAYTDFKNITLSECTALGMVTRSNAQTAGYVTLCEELGINFRPWDEEDYVDYTNPKWTHITTPRKVPKSLNPMEFNHFINAPIIKNHEMVAAADYTCCIKAFMGVLPFAGAGGRSDMHSMDISEKLAEMHLLVPNITMNVVDATTPGLIGGPTPSQTGNAGGLIVASTDRVACDSVALAVLKCYAKKANVLTPTYVNKSVWDQAQISFAAKLGLGVNDPKKIEILDKDVDNITEIKAQWV
jgi:uncharacterized protein (DUF362 family)